MENVVKEQKLTVLNNEMASMASALKLLKKVNIPTR